MAINPNTDFVSGAVLNASEQNRFPRGIMAYSEKTSSSGVNTTEAVEFTLTFTAVANRYYKLSYHEPILQVPSGVGTATEARFRLNNVSGTELYFSQAQNNATNQYAPDHSFQRIQTFSAGSVTVVATLKASSGTSAAFRTSTAVGFFMVEDIGPA
jgi:hypothetical protein